MERVRHLKCPKHLPNVHAIEFKILRHNVKVKFYRSEIRGAASHSLDSGGAKVREALMVRMPRVSD